MRAILCVFALALVVMAGCDKLGKDGASGGVVKALTTCKFQSDGDATSCIIDVDIVEGCQFSPHKIYVATGAGKFGGTVTLKVDPAKFQILDVTFKDGSMQWSKPSGSTIPYTLRIDPGKNYEDHDFQAKVRVVGNGSTCTTPDPVIGNGKY